MASASTPQSYQSPDAGTCTLGGRSYVQKSVCLQDWWLIKPETGDDKQTIGVGGVICTSQENRAERSFFSAAILKVYDFFELETVDGVCVILQGLINKDRTLQSGFSSEVFNHFIIGFPPYWEKFATSCAETGSARECLSRDSGNSTLEQEDAKDSTEGYQDIQDTAVGKSGHRDIMDNGVQDREDTDLSNKTITDYNESSLHEHITKAGHPLKSTYEDTPILMASPMSIDVHSMKADVFKSPLSKNFKTDAVNSSTMSKCSEIFGRCVTRSMRKMDNSKNHSAQESLVHNTPSLDESDALPNNMAVDVVDCGENKLLHVASGFPTAAQEVAGDNSSSLGDKFDPVELPVSSVDDTVAPSIVFSSVEHSENCELQNLRSHQEGISSSSCVVKRKSRRNILTLEKNPDEQNLKKLSSNLSVGYGTCSHEVARCSPGVVLGTKSKGKQDGRSVIVDVTENQRNESSSQVGTVDGGLVNASAENFNGASSVLGINEGEALSRTSTKACQNKKSNIAGNSNSMVDVPHPDKDGNLNAGVAKQGIASQEASMTGNKSKRKITFGSAERNMGTRQRITSPKSAQCTPKSGVSHLKGTTAGKGSEERYGSANILSPDSLSSKRSRSGRLLLPTLEFWRNQTAVYDLDRQVTGVRDGTYVEQSPRDVRKDNKAYKKNVGKPSKP